VGIDDLLCIACLIRCFDDVFANRCSSMYCMLNPALR
jgi:hypothetical protein